MLSQQGGGIVVHEKDRGPDIETFPRRADDKRSLAAFGDRDDHIAGPDANLAQLLPAERGKILKSLHRSDQGKVAAGHHAKDDVLTICYGRGGRWFSLLPESPPGRLKQNTQPPRRAAAGKKDFMSGADCFHQGRPQLSPFGRLEHALRHRRQIAIDALEHSYGRGQILPRGLAQIHRLGVKGFGRQLPEAECLFLFEILLRLLSRGFIHGVVSGCFDSTTIRPLAIRLGRPSEGLFMI